MSVILTKMALKQAAKKVGKPLQTQVRGRPAWHWVLGISVAALGVYGTVRYVRSRIASAEDSQSFGSDKHATWAKQIDNAFVNNGWWGTDENLLRQVLREIPSQEDFKQVQKSYKKLSKGENLITIMTGELKQTEYNEMLAIINSKPKRAKDAGAVIYDPRGWAKRLNAAVNYNTWGFLWGTDEDAITAVVTDIPTIEAFMDTAEVYKDLYGVPLMQDMRGDLDESTIADYKRLILQKPRE